ncbi:TetR family transcriptional regulator [Alteromonas aestuariivivens]|uniref:TetR family transcriptional regulator n=1 Tax=Alteromonas aestuariivivens TaxID=1938339 RepID=A0A3D8M6Z6_9ALTE|nr:TetR family transcriptional regulator [Alteromonas aestuariivivens]RDV25498.1 TetR family transcriptional regulator [Alteromonas aestuariivivens]
MRRTKEDAEKTKQDILDAAVDIFSEKGVAKASLEQIAQAANVTRGAVYWHFKNKIEIFDALHERLHTPFIQRILEGLEVEHPDPVAQLQELCTNLLIELDQDPQKKKALILFLLKCDYSGELEASKAQYLENKMQKLQAFSRYFDKAIAQGRLPADSNPRILTMAVSCYLRGIVLEYLEFPKQVRLKDDAAELMNFFFKNLLGSHHSPVPTQ